MVLQLLHKLVQIFYKFIFVEHEFDGFHQPVSLAGIKIPQIILIILIQTLKILLQKAPPLVNLPQICM